MKLQPTNKEKPLLPRVKPKQVSFDTPQAKWRKLLKEKK